MRRRTVITIGNFDGVHLGHRAILQRCRQIALQSTAVPVAQVVAVTFDRPPVSVLDPGKEPPQIDRLERRAGFLRQAGADVVDVLTVDRGLLEKSAEGFIHELVERWSPVAVVEGPDFRFGKGRRGDAALLHELGRANGFTFEVAPRQTAVLADRQVVPVSSSLARWLIGRGRVPDAAACLGRDFVLEARVVRGEQRGRQLGFPTANLDPDEISGFIVPADGVYAADAVLDDGTRRPAAVSIGTKPTFGKTQLTVEAHLPGFDGNLYDRRLALHFRRWLRDQFPFPGVESLKAQLNRDVDATENAYRRTPEPVA